MRKINYGPYFGSLVFNGLFNLGLAHLIHRIDPSISVFTMFVAYCAFDGVLARAQIASIESKND